MKLIKKLNDSTSLKLKELMNALEETGCSPKEKLKARKIFKIYLDGKAEIDKQMTIYTEQQVRDAFEELKKAISDIKEKYGDKIDTTYLQDRFEELIKNFKEDE